MSTPALAAAVPGAGGLGAIAVGATDAKGARAMIEETRARIGRIDAAFNVNLFVHGNPIADPERELAWLEWLAPLFAEFEAEPPKALRGIYRSFADDADMFEMLPALQPSVVSFHFGLSSADALSALRVRGIHMLATAPAWRKRARSRPPGSWYRCTRYRGRRAPRRLRSGCARRCLGYNGPDAAVGAGDETAGHRCRRNHGCAGIAAALNLGAVAAQLGTAFIACPESAADDAYRAALTGPGSYHTTLTSLISGRPARAIANRFTALVAQLAKRLPPDYPIAYDAGKALDAAAKARGEHGFGAQWAGQGAPLARAMPAAILIETLKGELDAVRHRKVTEAAARYPSRWGSSQEDVAELQQVIAMA